MLDFYSRQPSANSHERSIDMEIQAKQATVKGPPETFTGDVWFDVITRGEDYARMRVNVVRFAPSARTAWHAHPGGQTLYVTEGRGLVQSRGGAVIEIRPGDVIYTPPGEWHWHGAAPDHFMTHIAMSEVDENGSSANRAEHVSDAEYAGQASHGATSSRLRKTTATVRTCTCARRVDRKLR